MFNDWVMILYLSFIFFRGLIVSGEKEKVFLKVKPEKCYGTDDITERRCCIFPPFFDRQAARECGAYTALVFVDKTSNVTGLRRETTRGCDHWKCLLPKYGLLDSEYNLNVESYYEHLDKWVALNPAFSTIMVAAKLFCKQINKMYMPINTCDFFEFQACIRNYINVDCPKVIQSQYCSEWKEFFDECREFFI